MTIAIGVDIETTGLDQERGARIIEVFLSVHDLKQGVMVDSYLQRIEKGTSNPPEDTRAYFRGACLAKFGSDIVSANWDSLVFDTGGDSLRRVAMMEPSRGTAAHVASVIESSQTAAELLDRLGS